MGSVSVRPRCKINADDAVETPVAQWACDSDVEVGEEDDDQCDTTLPEG